MTFDEERASSIHSEEDYDDASSSVKRHPWRRWPYRVSFALAALAVVVLVGGLSIWISGEGEYGLAEAIYFSLITVSTVGYGELPHLHNHPWARGVSAVTIVFGLIVMSLFHATLTALFVQGVFGKAFRKRRMNRLISELKEHHIVVGCGRVGRYVAEELHRMSHPFVVIEQDPAAIHRLETELHKDVLSIQGSATEDEVLQAAGIERAIGMAATLSLDRDNLFVTLSARTMNPELRIVAKVVNSANDAKFLRAGASATVSPQSIGGRRVANELVRPEATAFFENMMRVPKGVGFHEILIHLGSFLAGKTLREARLRDEYDLLVVAFISGDGSYHYNPDSESRVEPGGQIIVLGQQAEALRLRKDLAGHL